MIVADNLTPNPFPNGKGDRSEENRFASAERDRSEETRFAAARLVAVGAIAIYRAAVSPVIHALNGPACRFEPSCSEYARDAIAEYGVVRGGAMAIWRVARCNPIGGHGFDPVRGRGGR